MARGGTSTLAKRRGRPERPTPPQQGSRCIATAALPPPTSTHHTHTHCEHMRRTHQDLQWLRHTHPATGCRNSRPWTRGFTLCAEDLTPWFTLSATRPRPLESAHRSCGRPRLRATRPQCPARPPGSPRPLTPPQPLSKSACHAHSALSRGGCGRQGELRRMWHSWGVGRLRTCRRPEQLFEGRRALSELLGGDGLHSCSRAVRRAPSSTRCRHGIQINPFAFALSTSHSSECKHGRLRDTTHCPFAAPEIARVMARVLTGGQSSCTYSHRPVDRDAWSGRASCSLS